MSSLKSFITQLDEKEIGEPKAVVATISQFDPPTKGHGELIKSVQTLALALEGDAMVIMKDAKKNLLPSDIKVAFMAEMFPGVNLSDAPGNIWDLPKWLAEAGYTDVKLVVGDDQVDEYNILAENVGRIFNSFEIVGAGIDNPDTSDAMGMSSRRARQAAQGNDIGKFRVATGWSGERAARLMEATSICMGA